MCLSAVLNIAMAGDDSLVPMNRFPQMVHNWYLGQLREIHEEGNRRRDALKTKEDAEAYVKDVRAKIQDIFGQWPEKTPLKPRITGTVERDLYRIEKLVYESRPNFLVSANLYIPKGKKLPAPGIVAACGHANTAKLRYQYVAQGLARQGYVVLVYDPISQGERSQYGRKKSEGFWGHMQIGCQQYLVDEFFGAWRAWDGIRALDYLLTREEVDPKHLGIVGNSGGGTMTTWLCAVEPRFTMAAPSCFLTRYLSLLENVIMGSDPEQCPPRVFAEGLDELDFIAATAPDPVIMLAQEQDKYFDIRGTETAFTELKKVYKALGSEENIDLFVGPHEHKYSQETLAAQSRWFNRITGLKGEYREDEIGLEKGETLLCAPKGQVANLGSKGVPEFTKEKSTKLAKQRPSKFSQKELREVVRNSLNFDGSRVGQAPHYRIYGRHGLKRGYPKNYATVYMVETEPGIMALVYKLTDDKNAYRPSQEEKTAILYIAHESSDAELREEPLVKELMEDDPDAVMYACDVRGVGESRPAPPSIPFNFYGYFYAVNGIMLDKPYVGQKTYDILRVIDWLKAHNHTKIHLVGKGFGAVPATFAAVLSDDVDKVTLKNTLTSYSDVAECADYKWPLDVFVPNVLKYYDLPDCYRALKKKKLKSIEPWNAQMECD